MSFGTTIAIVELVVFAVALCAMAVRFAQASAHHGRAMLFPAALFSGCMLMILGMSLTGLASPVTYLGINTLVGITVAGVIVSCIGLILAWKEQYPAKRGLVVAWAICLGMSTLSVDPRREAASGILLWTVTAMDLIGAVTFLVWVLTFLYARRRRHV
jgi:hypothetical protein